MADSAPKRAKPSVFHAHHNVDAWYEENKAVFAPPVCNKLMYKEQINVMFVGGPNSRTDFHLDLGSEFFFQMKGNMELPTIQQGKKKVVRIGKGQVYLLPSRIPHSPQRPEAGSLGLVVERTRNDDEVDGLRWYTDFDKCENVLWERYFQCTDLGRDLVPVVKAFKSSEEATTMVPGSNVVADADRPWPIDHGTDVPAPFLFDDFLAEHAAALKDGACISLFGADHPDKEFDINVYSGPFASNDRGSKWETWFYMYKGSADVTTEHETLHIADGCCAVMVANTKHSVSWAEGSIGLVVIQDPTGNK